MRRRKEGNEMKGANDKACSVWIFPADEDSSPAKGEKRKREPEAEEEEEEDDD